MYISLIFLKKLTFDSGSLAASTSCYQIHLLPFNIGKYWEHSENFFLALLLITYNTSLKTKKQIS